MLSDILKIVASIDQRNKADERYRKTGEQYLMAGKNDGRFGVIDEFGKLHELANQATFENNGNEGELRIKHGLNTLILKWGTILVDTGEATQTETIHNGNFSKAFPNNCSVMLVSQRENNAVTSIMAKPHKDGYKLTLQGGLNSESLSFLAIGY